MRCRLAWVVTLLVLVPTLHAGGPFVHGLAHCLREGQIDFYDETSRFAWNQTVTLNGGATALLAEDPMTAGGRVVEYTTTFVNADLYRRSIPMQYQPIGLSNNEAPHRTVKFQTIIQMMWSWPDGPPGNNRRQSVQRLMRSAPQAVASISLLETAAGEVIQASMPGTVLNGSVDVSSLRDAWTTWLIEYEASIDGGDGLIRVTLAPGLQFTGEGVRNAPGALVALDRAHPVDLEVSFMDIQNNPLSHDKRCDIWFRAMAWSSDELDPEVMDRMVVDGQLREPSDDRLSIFALAPGGAMKSDWHNDGSIRMTCRYWPASDDESTAQETPLAEATVLSATSFWKGFVFVDGLDLDTSAYRFRLRFYDATDDGDFEDAVNVLTYRPPVAPFRMGIGTCAQSSGAAHPYAAFSNALNAGCIAFLLTDDIGYVDGLATGSDPQSVSDFGQTYYEFVHDKRLAKFGREGCFIVRHGDHQWRNEWEVLDRSLTPDKWENGLEAWNQWFQFGKHGPLDPDISDPTTNAALRALGNHLACAWDWGPFRVVSFDDVTRFDPRFTTLVGDVQMDALKAAWTGTTKPLVMLVASRIGGPIRRPPGEVTGTGPQTVITVSEPIMPWVTGDLIALLDYRLRESNGNIVEINGTYELTAIDATTFSVPVDTSTVDLSHPLSDAVGLNIGPDNVQQATFWNGAIQYSAELGELFDDLATGAPDSRVIAITGDSHIMDINTIDDARPNMLFEWTAGPVASQRFNTRIRNDWSAIPTTWTFFGKTGTRLYTLAQGDRDNQDLGRLFGIMHFDGAGVSLHAHLATDDATELHVEAFDCVLPVGITELLQYLSWWFAQSIEADLDNNGATDILDLLEFIAGYVRAVDCP